MTDSAKKTLIILAAVFALGTLFWFAYLFSGGDASPVEELPVPMAARIDNLDDTPNTPNENEDLLPPTAPAAEGDRAILTSQTWTWVRTEMNDDSLITPNKPGIFTVTFNEDGRVNLGTDCNSMSGSYSLPAVGQIAFAPFSTTFMFCEGSQEGEFSGKLRDSTGYMFEDDQLVLQLKYDSGSVFFE